MKKSLFAIAAATAFTGAAQAQSSVTVYGILDVGYTGGNARAQTTTVTKENVSRISNSMESGSRIGFRGNEDLGGGTAAQFVFELGIQPAGNAGSNQTGIGTAAVTQGTATWAPNVRQAFVGLSQKGRHGKTKVLINASRHIGTQGGVIARHELKDGGKHQKVGKRHAHYK